MVSRPGEKVAASDVGAANIVSVTSVLFREKQFVWR